MKRLAVLATSIVVVVGLLLIAGVVFAPAWLVRHDLGSGGRPTLSAGDRLNAVNDVRATLLQGLAAMVALGGVGLGALTTLRQVRVHREGQFIDRFTKAIEQLSSDHVGTRMGGVYAMEQIAEVAPHYRGPIAALPASFVRQHAPGRRPGRRRKSTLSGSVTTADCAMTSAARWRHSADARWSCPAPRSSWRRSTCAVRIWPGRT